MVQQINRCRDIIGITYCFPNKCVKEPKYNSLDDVKKEIELREKLNMFEHIVDDECNKQYKELYALINYELYCVKTNKFLHMQRIMKKRGVIVDDIIIHKEKTDLTSRKKMIETELLKFDVNEIKIKVEEDGTVIPGKTNEIQSKLF